MPKTKAQIIAEAQVVKNATEVGENTATRVGGVLEDLADADSVVIIPVTGTSSGGNITLSSNPFTQVQTAVNAGQHVVVRVTIASDIIDFTMNTYSASVATYIGTANFLENEFQLLCSASSAVITNRSTSNTFSTGESVPNVGIDATPTQGSDNLVKSGGVWDAIEGGFYRPPYDAEVEYIEFSGTQYIDVGIIPSNTHGILLDILPTATTGYPVCIGMRNGSTTETRFTIGVDASSNKFYIGWAAYYNLNNVPYRGARHQMGLNYLNARNATYDNNVVKTPLQTLPFTPAYPIYVGCYNVAGSPSSYASCKIYNVKISNGEEIVFDGIPVRKDGKGCLYDKVSEELFENIGTGIITYGEDIEL